MADKTAIMSGALNTYGARWSAEGDIWHGGGCVQVRVWVAHRVVQQVRVDVRILKTHREINDTSNEWSQHKGLECYKQSTYMEVHIL